MDSGDRRGGYPQKRRAQGTFGRAMAALCALVPDDDDDGDGDARLHP